MDKLETINIRTWEDNFSAEIPNKAIEALESGKVLFFPELIFTLNDAERKFLSPRYVNQKSKNISFDIRQDKLGGACCNEQELLSLKNMMQRYAESAQTLVTKLLPKYNNALEIARTSFRPVEILGRESSYRKDDTRLHVDAFPATPNQGKRILRVFTNINPEGKQRVWRLGEPFETVATKFYPQLPKPILGSARFLKLFKLTKSYRTSYDHFMLQMHNAMKGDMDYQKAAKQAEIKFPPGSTWIVYTDCVSHAAMAGQHLFEQTFYLPVNAMQNEIKSPLRILERISGQTLV